MSTTSSGPETMTVAWSKTLGLADSFALSVYDAAYLELALRRDCRWRRWMIRYAGDAKGRRPEAPLARYPWNPRTLVAMESAEQAWTPSPAPLKPDRKSAASSARLERAAVGATCGRPHGYPMVRAQ